MNNQEAFPEHTHLVLPNHNRISVRSRRRPQLVEGGGLLVLVHGGPGVDNHKELLRAFAESEAFWSHACHINYLVAYDQLGCGESDKPADPALYTLESFVQELGHVLDWAAGYGAVSILGHSWGGQVVMELLLKGQAPKISGAIVSNSPLDQMTYQERHVAHRNGLPQDLRDFIWQEEIEKSEDGTVESLVYSTLVGIHESEIIGSMANWSALNRLDALTGGPPVLIVVGGSDKTESAEEMQLPAVLSQTDIRTLVLDSDHFPFYGAASGEYFCNIGAFLTPLHPALSH